MGHGPAGRLREFSRCGSESSKISFVLAPTLVHRRVELEVDLVESAREMNPEELSEIAPLETLLESGRQAEVEQAFRSWIEPVLR